MATSTGGTGPAQAICIGWAGRPAVSRLARQFDPESRHLEEAGRESNGEVEANAEAEADADEVPDEHRAFVQQLVT